MKKFCPNCGSELKGDLAFCPNCGSKIETGAKNKPDKKKSEPVQKDDLKKAQTKPAKQKEEKTKPQIFCPNCGHVLKAGAEFCSHCGYNLKTKQLPKQSAVNTDSSNKANKQLPKRPPRKPLSKKNKIILSIVGVLAVLLIGFYAWGSSYYSENNQIDRITSGLKDPKQDISKYVVADTKDMKVTASSLKPLQNYYQEHQTTATKLNANLKQGEGNSTIQLVRRGRYWLLFPKYQLQVKTYQPQIVTNHSDSVVTVNGKDIGKLNNGSDNYYKKLSLVFPGKYHVVVKSKVAGRNLSATSTANIWSNETLDMDIKTQTFSVKSVPNGEVYINDKKVGTLDDNGEANFESYPITRNMELYVLYKADGKNLKSETVTDMPSEFGAFDDEDNDYDSDDSGSGNDVQKTDDGYVVEPQWKGIISKDDAESLLNGAFSDVDEDKFVDSSANKDYSDLKQQQKSWNDNDDIDDWDADVDVEAVYPASDNSCTVIYKVSYSFDNGDSTKKQVMEFKGAVIQTDGDDSDNAKIKTIGKGKLISSKDFDN